MIESLAIFSMLPLSELVQVSEWGNVIIQDIRTTYYYELRLVLVYNVPSKKYNAYIIDYFNDLSTTNDPDVIVKCFKPLSLDEANRAFMSYTFTKESYGF